MQLTVPRLDDGVVALRPPSAADVDAITEACQDPEIPRWTRVPSPYTRAHAVDFVERSVRTWNEGSDAPFVIIDAESGALLGAIGVHRFGGEDDGPEVGYWLERGARGRGVATRALRLVSDWACGDLGVRLLLQADVRNTASRRVAEKARFRYVGKTKAPEGCGECDTMAVYELTQ
ncbi:MAG TPA: GNAT family N-acetyltransferase [Acidimicrobiia bacterium]|nr:GNAT family N-acetyltransferase [Acidimicrobiia bacterium]